MIRPLYKPSIEQIISRGNEIPGYEKVIPILEKELKNGNKILSISNAGTLPDVTHIIIQLEKKTVIEYDNLKDYGTPYKSLFFSDNKGVTEIMFDLGE